MMYRVTRKETYVAWVSATSEERVQELVNEMSNGDSAWLSEPNDIEIEIELMREVDGSDLQEED